MQLNRVTSTTSSIDHPNDCAGIGQNIRRLLSSPKCVACIVHTSHVMPISMPKSKCRHRYGQRAKNSLLPSMWWVRTPRALQYQWPFLILFLLTCSFSPPSLRVLLVLRLLPHKNPHSKNRSTSHRSGFPPPRVCGSGIHCPIQISKIWLSYRLGLSQVFHCTAIKNLRVLTYWRKETNFHGVHVAFV